MTLKLFNNESATDFVDAEALYLAELQKQNEHVDRLKTEMENIYDLTANFANDLDGSKGLAVFGPPGVGKTKMVTQALIDANASVEYHKGADMSPAGLYGLLWFNRSPHRVLVLDDVDLNKGGQESKAIIALLKSATEMTYKPREVSWIKAAPNSQMREHNIPAKFEYWGNIIWITNDRPEDLLKKQSTAKHFSALVGEGGRFTPAILDWNKKDKYLWTKYLIEDCDMLGKNCESRRGGYTKDISDDVLQFFKKYYPNLIGITPRYATKVAHNRFRFPTKWEKMSLLANSIEVKQ